MECSIPNRAGSKVELRILQYLQVSEAENIRCTLFGKLVPLKSVIKILRQELFLQHSCPITVLKTIFIWRYYLNPVFL